MSLCRRPYIDRRKEFSEEERDRLTKIDNEIWEKAKDSKLFFKVYPLVGKPGYQIKNNASINSIYNFVSEINKKYDKKIVKLSKRTEFKKEILSVNVMPLSRETIRELYIQNLQAKNQQMIDARRSGIDYSEDYLFQESDTIEEKNDLKDLGLEQRLFSESKDTTSLEILNKIANSDHNLASLAAHLIPYAKYVNAKVSLVEDIKPGLIAKNPNGSYNPTTGNILIKRTENFTSARAEATILHEIIHSLTYYELRKETEENAYFTELFNHAELYLGTLNLYGLSNKDEFMTALFTDADFIKQLQNVPPLNKKKYKNLFEEVFDKILKLLRITKSSPFYEEAFSTATNIIENFRQSAIEQENYEEYLKSSAYEESLYSEEQTSIKPVQTVESYRAQEQAELSQRIPNIENYKIDGKVVKSLITDENDLKTYNEIYNKYDALITPLLNDNPELTNFIKNLSDFKRVVGKKTVRLVLKNVGESVSYDVITKRKNKTDDTLVYVLSELQKNKSGKVEAEDSKFKNAGVYAYLDFIINNQDKEIVVDNVITSKGMTVLKKLEKLGVVTATKAELEGVMRSPVKNKDNDIYFYKSAPFEYNKAFLINQSKISLATPNEILEDKIKENALFSFLKQFDFDVKAFNSEYGYTNKETLDILNRILYVDVNNFENDFKNQFVDFLQFFLKYDSEYNNLLKRYTKEEIKNSFLKNLEVENKKINAFKKLIDKVLDALRLKKDYLNYYTTDIINRIYNNDATVLNYYKGLRPGSTSLSTLSSYDKNIVKDPQAEEIINAFADEFSLTGSIVLGEQGTTYTSDNNPFHDIDYQASGKTKEEIEEIVYKKFPNAQFFRSIPNEDYTTYTYIVPTGDYKIENLDIRAKEKNGKIYKDVYGYDVVDKDGKVVGTYRMEKQKTGKMTIFGNEEKKKNEDERGVKAKIVDFFQSDAEKQYFVKTYKGKNIKMAFWTDIMKAKLEYLRPKDIHDILLFNKEKLPQELKKQTNDTKNKIAINKLFESLPILGTIGTEEQYLRHFNSVYSDTSVPIVVYRAVKHEGSELKDKSFFTDDPEYAIKYGDILKPYKLNILNPYTSTKVGIHRASIGSMLEDPMVDGIIGKESLNNVSMRAVTIELQEAQEEGRYLSTEGAIRRLAGPLTDTNSFVTTNVNQVYELGTEIDVYNFKEFVRNDLGTKELNKKSVSLYSKIFDISEDEINERLKNCG
jgi:hypothetical protein